MSTVEIRAARTADLPAIVAFNAGIARETEDLELDPQRLSDGVRAILEDASKGRYFVAEIAGEVVGQAMVTTEWSDWRNGDFWWFQSVYVQPDARARGVFKALYRHIEKEARRCDEVCGLRLYVDAHNARAIEVYTRLGMTTSNYRVMESDYRLNREE